MRFNFKKISAVLTSIAMIGSSIGVVAAANYPLPFVSGSTTSVAVVYGTGAGVSYLDVAEAGNIQSDLQSKMTGTSGTSGGSSTGEVAELFTGSTKIYLNDTLRTVKSVLTKTEMPTTLADTSFSGDVDATVSQTINLGSDPIVSYRKGPTSENDPVIGLAISTTSGQVVYNATATFSQAINASHADSLGESIDLFGTSYTISSSTDSDTLVLLKSAEKVTLTSDANPSQEVTVGGNVYTIELVSASDTAATVQVTNSAGTTESKEISEAQSKKVNGIQVAVINADETNQKLSASVVAGSDKITLQVGSEVTTGDDNTAIDGTLVTFSGIATATGSLSKLVVSVRAPTSDGDYIKPGTTFVDPVFGTFKVDFAGVNIDETSTARETMKIQNTGDDKAQITFTDWRGNEKTIQFANNASIPMNLQWDSESNNITVVEGEKVYKNGYVVVGNEDEGYLLKVSTLSNSTTAYSSDSVKFQDVISGDTYSTVITEDGEGTVSVGGKIYNVIYGGASTVADTSRWVSLEYPDSSTAGYAVAYPTIQTSKGAKVAFYEPVTIDLTNFNQKGTDLAGIKISDGDTYDTAVFAHNATDEVWMITRDSAEVGVNMTAAGADSTIWTVGTLYFNITGTAVNSTKIYLQNPSTRLNIVDPAIIVWEEKDDNSRYEALVVTMDAYGSSSDKVGVDDIYRTWMTSVSTGDGTYRQTLYSDSDIAKEIDLYGTIVTKDSNTADQAFASISYPDEQIYAQIYMAETDASITAGTSGTTTVTQLGDVKIKDTEVSSVSGKNLIVLGGSCINSVAAKLLGGAYCEASFTEKAGVSAGQGVIQSFGDAYTTGKIALLVAGYNAEDTVNAASYLRTKTVDTTAGVKYICTSATACEKQ